MDSAVVHRDFEASVTAKIQRRVLPLLIAGWFVAYIDRSMKFDDRKLRRPGAVRTARYGSVARISAATGGEAGNLRRTSADDTSSPRPVIANAARHPRNPARAPTTGTPAIAAKPNPMLNQAIA